MIRLHGYTVVMSLALLSTSGCVRRTLTIDTDPQGAIVVLNDQEIGPSPASVDFTWYGDYDVVVRKPGFQTLHTNTVIETPWYQMPPVDFFFDVVWPRTIHDQRRAAFTLEPWVAPDPDDVVERAGELRLRALADTDKKPM